MLQRFVSVAVLVLITACSGKDKSDGNRPDHTTTPKTVPTQAVISILGTNDLHGHISRLPTLAGYIANLRAARKTDGGVLLVDAGDLFQGTLASNLTEGASVIDAYNTMGYAAAAVGNHEFDFGPAGPKSVPVDPGDDPRGALRARVAQAKFPILTANIINAKTGKPPTWARSDVMVEIGKINIGIIGVSTMATPYTTTSANFVGLEMVPLKQAIVPLARSLRAKGAAAIVVLAHAGGRCRGKKHDPNDLSRCDQRQEIFQLARQLPKGTVDVVIAGHTHARIAHRVNGIAIVESMANGVAFGRVDMYIERATKHLVKTVIEPTRYLCKRRPTAEHPCEPGDYAGAPVKASSAIAKLIAGAKAKAEKLREQSLGVAIKARFRRSRSRESALGNLIADLMRAVRPKADVGLTNGGGLRADLPKGPLTYGEFYQAQPFDNRFATITLSAAELADVMRFNLRHATGIFSISGVRINARCEGKKLRVTLLRNGKPLADNTPLRLVTSDFLATGGDGAFASLRKRNPKAVALEGGETIREAMVQWLRKHGGVLDPAAYYDRRKRRIHIEGPRPLRCR